MSLLNKIYEIFYKYIVNSYNQIDILMCIK